MLSVNKNPLLKHLRSCHTKCDTKVCDRKRHTNKVRCKNKYLTVTICQTKTFFVSVNSQDLNSIIFYILTLRKEEKIEKTLIPDSQIPNDDLHIYIFIFSRKQRL